MNLENVISDFESQLRNVGFSELNGAILIQVNIGGKNYIKSSGNLNILSAPATIIKTEKEHNLIEFIIKEIEMASISESTKKLHRETAKILCEYNANIKLEEVTTAYLLGLDTYLTSKKFAVNTIGRHMKALKRYINVARKKELITKYPFLGYTIRSEQTHREYLTEKELELLEQYRELLTEPDETLNAFLFSCYTGLRYSDVRRFTKQHICLINRKKWGVIKMMKTNIEVRIPLATIFDGKALALCKDIRRSRGLLFHLKNSQQTNRHLKRVAKKVGIKKKISFHAGRHTCATLLLYRGVNITTVQTILGHASVKTTQIYSAVTDLTIEKEIKKSNKKKKK